MKILLTGASGFIGSHIVEHLLKNTDWEIITLDRLNVSGNHNRFTDMEIWPREGHRVKPIVHDLRCAVNEVVADQIGQVNFILHLAASTHVDRSITDPMGFVLDNMVATTNILEFARKQGNLKAFLYFSTDEVFGPAPEGVAYKEWDRYNAGNPYAAAKAGGEEMTLAFANTYRLPCIITHTMNVFGERQHPEKFIPMTIQKILKGEKILIHSNKDKTKAGSRFWIHGRNVAAAILTLLEKWPNVEMKDAPLLEGHMGPHWQKPGCIPCDKFNIVGEKELDNLEMAQFIFDAICEADPETPRKFEYEMVDFHSSRPGHDLRYGLDGAKMKAMGWSLPLTFEESLRHTIRWYLDHKNWLGIK